jgi:redox-sensitive bicupin YhaK (pirin superfamily)
MAVQFSPVITPIRRGNGSTASVEMFDLREMREWASPVTNVFHSRQRGRGFEPHPHAGFSAITYVFEDSQTGMRTRDSLGGDIAMGPGGIVWSQAGSGMIHEETAVDPDRELHGLQVFVNLRSKDKLAAPKVFDLAASRVPVWQSEAGDRVRVVVGSFEGLSSPLVPAEPFDWLDVELRRDISFDLKDDHNALVYAVSGEVLVRGDGREQKVEGGQALAIHGSDGGARLTCKAVQPAHLLIFSGTPIREPVVFDSQFMMNEPSQIEAAAARYRAGEMGHLTPLSNKYHERPGTIA